tara:strand:- start:12 stop:413 length:402 start_codon:yes stop_codon:yes gene_type:complete
MSTKQKEASKKASKKIAKLREEKIQQDFGKAVAPVMEKKGVKGEIAAMQFEEAISPKNIGKAEKLAKKTFKKGDMSSIKKIADAAADDTQLASTERKIVRDLMRGGGRAGYKAGSKGCKLAIKGKGRAYGKNS